MAPESVAIVGQGAGVEGMGVALAPQGATPTQAGGQYKVEIVEVKYKYNISIDGIKKFLKDWVEGYIPDVSGPYMRDMGEGNVAVYAYDTWGRCRVFKLVATIDGQFIPGEWVDRSSHKNAHKFKITPIENIVGKNVELYVHESPSCNKSKEYTFRVVVRVTR